LKEGLLLHRDRFAILDLTIYEVGNAVWRAYRREAIKQPVLVARMFEEVLKGLEKLSVGPVLFEVLDNVARREGLKLVTKDSDLLKFPEAISLKAMLKELKS
jgi:predicted nucleic acid-binding protein